MTLDTTFAFETQALSDLARDTAVRYRGATPFPHVVLDDFLPEAVLDEVLEEFPGVDDGAWWRFDSDRERKLGSPDQAMMGRSTQHLFAHFNGPTFVDFLSEMTGIGGLVPDPHLFGGGLHQIEPGGFLEVHADFNLHPLTRLERRLNVLVYLNRDWQESWGGELELWESDMSQCAERIQPVFNRCVVFSTTDTSYHGHPVPLSCPSGTTRRSLALYYYSLPATLGAPAEHNTVFPRNPEPEEPPPAPRGRLRELGSDLLPPLAIRMARTVTRRAPGRGAERGAERDAVRGTEPSAAPSRGRD
ncbi:MAG: 2OG-Fe(II) oxygenase [Acidimicrobiales bacterium]